MMSDGVGGGVFASIGDIANKVVQIVSIVK